jgi:hypothetical protein
LQFSDDEGKRVISVPVSSSRSMIWRLTAEQATFEDPAARRIEPSPATRSKQRKTARCTCARYLIGGQIMGEGRDFFARCCFGITTSEIIFFSLSDSSISWPMRSSDPLFRTTGDRWPCRFTIAMFPDWVRPSGFAGGIILANGILANGATTPSWGDDTDALMGSEE